MLVLQACEILVGIWPQKRKSRLPREVFPGVEGKHMKEYQNQQRPGGQPPGNSLGRSQARGRGGLAAVPHPVS